VVTQCLTATAASTFCVGGPMIAVFAAIADRRTCRRSVCTKYWRVNRISYVNRKAYTVTSLRMFAVVAGRSGVAAVMISRISYAARWRTLHNTAVMTSSAVIIIIIFFKLLMLWRVLLRPPSVDRC